MGRLSEYSPEELESMGLQPEIDWSEIHDYVHEEDTDE